MKKFKLYLSLCLLPILLLSCDDSKEVSYDIEGRWSVKSRVFVCKSDDPALQADVEYAQKLFDGLYYNYQKEEREEYILFRKDGEVGYFEEGYVNYVESSGFDLSRYKGSYSASSVENNLLDIVITNIGITWSYSVEVVDVNNNFIYLKQKMNSDDINRFINVYFGSQEEVKEGITAEWQTQAFKGIKSK